MKKEYPPIELTPELKSLVKAVFMAKAWVETVHPIVTGYQRAILEEIGGTDEEGNPVIDPNMSYCLSEEEFRRYSARCDEEAARNKLKHGPECCPLLEAEEVERKAKRALGEYMIPRLPGFGRYTYDDFTSFVYNNDNSIKRDKLGRMMFKRDEMIELILRLLVPQMAEELQQICNHSKVSDVSNIVERYKT